MITLDGIYKSFGSVSALSGVSLTVAAGTIHAVAGENGAGKSTLTKIIAGEYQPDRGTLRLDGERVRWPSPRHAQAAGIHLIHQELALFGNLSVAENIFVGRELTRGALGIDHRLQERRAGELLGRLEAGVDPRALVEDLRIGQQQLVEIAKAVAQETRILILDEPTSALSATEVEILFRIIRDLKARGVAIVYISHRLEELVRIGDFITVLRDGRVTGRERMADVDVAWIVRQMIGSASKDFAKTVHHEIGEEAFRAEDICLPRLAGGYEVDHVWLSVRKGEILGVYGLMGAGRSEFLDCVIGRRPHATGRIFIEGRLVAERDVTGRIRRGLALIPEDRQREGLVAMLSVAANLTMASLGKFLKGFHIVGARERAAVGGAIRDLAIRVADPAQEVASLSGGNQQKVVIGKALMTNPKVLLMDEPSRGVDVGAKAEVFRTMRRLAAEGLGVIFVTSDLDEVMALSDRIAVMSNGRVTALFDRAQASEAELVAASALGHGNIGHGSGGHDWTENRA